MPGEFTGLTDDQWETLKPLLHAEPERRWKGQPPAPFRKVLNTIIYVLITGCRWCDIPVGFEWGKRSTSHRWLGIWLSDGTLEKIKSRLLGVAHLSGKIDWTNGSIDGSFVAGKGGGESVDRGFKGKGVTIHALVDGKGNPIAVTCTGASGDERAQVDPLLDSVDVKTGMKGRRKSRFDSLELDKGYDSEALRKKIRKRGTLPRIPRRKWANRKQPRGRRIGKLKNRWKVERIFAWLQRKFRRTVVRWERKMKYWLGFLTLAICFIWVNILLG